MSKEKKTNNLCDSWFEAALSGKLRMRNLTLLAETANTFEVLLDSMFS